MPFPFEHVTFALPLLIMASAETDPAPVESGVNGEELFLTKLMSDRDVGVGEILELASLAASNIGTMRIVDK